LPVSPQALPHAAQWSTSVSRSRQAPSQQVWLPEQEAQATPPLPHCSSLAPVRQVVPSQQPVHRSPLQVHVPP
jgi:hypothetical protein